MPSAGLTALQLVPFAIVGLNTVTETWDGSPLLLQVNQSATMAQTPNGSVVFAYQNEATKNNSGDLMLTSGGGAPIPLTVPALNNQPNILTQNWKGNNLTVTNVSVNNDTPIRIQAVGPGMPGTNPFNLPIGTPLALSPGATAQTNALPQYMQLNFQNTNGQFAVFVLIGGPPDSSGNNAYVISVNASSNTGPPSSQPAPPGYYATTTNNSYSYTFNWGSSVVFVANMSGLTSTGSQIVLRAL